MPANASRKNRPLERRRAATLDLSKIEVAEGVTARTANKYVRRQYGRHYLSDTSRRISAGNLNWPALEVDAMHEWKALAKIRGWSQADDIMAMMELTKICQGIAEHNEQMTIILAELGLERRVG